MGCGCGKLWLVALQMGALIGVGAALGYMDQKRRPVMVNAPEITPLPPTSTTPTTPHANAPTDAPSNENPTPVAPATADTTASDHAPAEPIAAPAKAPPEVPETPKGEQIDEALVKQGHITVAQAFDLFNAQPPAFFLDARRKDIYEAGHVENAFRLPLEAFKGQQPTHLQVMPREDVYVVYCEGGNCDESVAVQKQLLLSGYQKVYVMHAGYPGWKDAGHPIQLGEDPIEASEGRP